ncbi:NUDIX domain-containing protein [Dactylosporangium sp. CA-139066]|uniref:NUDIX domain-containing protein n=1 Tax=Dactylosporangium sp. CA-139066 TaxID=3239930 RepID=UPI003D8F698F
MTTPPRRVVHPVGGHATALHSPRSARRRTPRRAPPRHYAPSRWDTPSGKRRPGERLEDGMARHALKETGLRLPPHLLHVVTMTHWHPPDRAPRIGVFFNLQAEPAAHGVPTSPNRTSAPRRNGRPWTRCPRRCCPIPRSASTCSDPDGATRQRTGPTRARTRAVEVQRIAIVGAGSAGKTVLANQLSTLLAAPGVPVGGIARGGCAIAAAGTPMGSTTASPSGSCAASAPPQPSRACRPDVYRYLRRPRGADRGDQPPPGQPVPRPPRRAHRRPREAPPVAVNHSTGSSTEDGEPHRSTAEATAGPRRPGAAGCG